MNKKQTRYFIPITLFLLNGCATLGLSPLKDRMLQSVKYSERELATADAENSAVISQYGAIYDTQDIARLDSIKNKIQAVLPRKDIDFQIHILNSKDVNAMTTGGRHIYIFKGLLDDARSDDELSCIIAHEIAHSLSRHRAKRTTIGILTGLGSIAVTAATQGKESMQTVTALAAQALPATFSRGDEREADVLAAAFAYEAGYDISKAQYFFERLAEKERVYNTKVNAELMPALNIAINNYNIALNNYNTWISYYQNWPNPNNYNGLVNAQNQMNYYYSYLQEVKGTYLNFALSNIGLFRTHPDSMSRANLFVQLSDYMRKPVSTGTLDNFDKSVANILNTHKEIKELSNRGFMNQSGVRALELFKKAKALYSNKNFEAAEGVLKEVLTLKPDYQEAIRLKEDLTRAINEGKQSQKNIYTRQDLSSDAEYFLANLSGKREDEITTVLGNSIETKNTEYGDICKKYNFDGRVILVYFKNKIVNHWTNENPNN